MTSIPQTKTPDESYYLTDLIGKKVTLNSKKIGKISDLIARENGSIPAVTDIIVGRPFGEPSLVIPWENVIQFSNDGFTVNIENIEKYAIEPRQKALLLKDYIIDKKVLDVLNREVEMVYDIKLVKKKNKLYVSAVHAETARIIVW